MLVINVYIYTRFYVLFELTESQPGQAPSSPSSAAPSSNIIANTGIEARPESSSQIAADHIISPGPATEAVKSATETEVKPPAPAVDVSSSQTVVAAEPAQAPVVEDSGKLNPAASDGVTQPSEAIAAQPVLPAASHQSQLVVNAQPDSLHVVKSTGQTPPTASNSISDVEIASSQPHVESVSQDKVDTVTAGSHSDDEKPQSSEPVVEAVENLTPPEADKAARQREDVSNEPSPSASQPAQAAEDVEPNSQHFHQVTPTVDEPILGSETSSQSPSIDPQQSDDRGKYPSELAVDSSSDETLSSNVANQGYDSEANDAKHHPEEELDSADGDDNIQQHVMDKQPEEVREHTKPAITSPPGHQDDIEQHSVDVDELPLSGTVEEGSAEGASDEQLHTSDGDEEHATGGRMAFITNLCTAVDAWLLMCIDSVSSVRCVLNSLPSFISSIPSILFSKVFGGHNIC